MGPKAAPKPNFSMLAEGESKQRIDMRISNELLLQIHKQVAVEKELARNEDWDEPKLTNVVEMLLRKGLRARKLDLDSQARQRPTM